MKKHFGEVKTTHHFSPKTSKKVWKKLRQKGLKLHVKAASFQYDSGEIISIKSI